MNTEQLVEYVRATKDGVVATLGPGGEPQAAYLSLTATDQGELLFNARADSRKIANLRRDPRIAVTVGGPDGTTLQCEGLADVPEGDDRARCAAAYVSTFPQFAGSLADEGIVLVRVRPTWSRYGDYRG
jgi:PPOX class probable F420-dependent enzyme